jgi:hypothetical protein
VTIEGVSFLSKGTVILGTPSLWVDQAGFTLEDGQAHTLYPRPVRPQLTRSSWRETRSAGGGPGGGDSDSGSDADAIEGGKAETLGGILGE